nr:MAG TPA: hypothetical protein [Caudoviricetes sp.]DAI53771.1 MAG TPA: hypothetical protein [Caudoviricetes sp.]
MRGSEGEGEDKSERETRTKAIEVHNPMTRNVPSFFTAVRE